jgi:hypothetical protein
MTPAEKELLQPFGYIVHLWNAYIERAPVEELQRMYAACVAVDQGNCWWAIYEAGKILRPLLRDEIERRKTRNPT